MLRALLLLLSALHAAPASASERATLRASVTVAADVVTFGDLLGGAGPIAATAIFRAPEIGSYGTIQAWRIIEAARSHGLEVEARGIAEVRVERTARSVGEIEILDLIAGEALRRFGADDRSRVELRLEGTVTSFELDAAPDAALLVERFAQDLTTSRFEAILVAVETSGRRSRPLRVTGTAVELVDIMRLRRPLGRGELVNASDLVIERTARARLPPDVVTVQAEAAGRAARRAMPEGTLLRAGDLERPRVISRNDPVTIQVESANLLVTARGRAIADGAVGDVIDVQNGNSRRTVQAVVVGPGRVAEAPRPAQAPAQPSQPAAPSR